MKQKLRLVRILVLISILTFAAPAFLSPVFAATTTTGTAATTTTKTTTTTTTDTKCEGEVRAGICFPETNLPDTPIEEILLNLMRWLFGIFGFLAIITFLIAGMQYFAAAGNPDTAKKAKQNMIYSIIGILVALSGFIIITAIANFLSGYDSF